MKKGQSVREKRAGKGEKERDGERINERIKQRMRWYLIAVTAVLCMRNSGSISDFKRVTTENGI